jgi:hypothetical protein
MAGNKEDRRYKRLEIGTHRLNATLAIITENKVTGCLVPIKDYSKSGAGVYVKFKVDLNSNIRISLEGVEFAPVDGRVVWCGGTEGDPNAPATHPFRLGIDFTPKDDSARENQLKVYAYITSFVVEE